MQAVITVVGKDRVGIIAAITAAISKHGVNVISINQTIVSGIFNMIMICEMPDQDGLLLNVQDELMEVGNKLGVQVKAQHMAIFESMHQID